MAQKFVAEPILIEAGRSLASDYQWASVPVKYLDTFSFIVNTASVTSGTGTFGVQVRMQVASSLAYSGWVDLTLDAIPTMAGVDQNLSISVDNKDFSEARLVYVADGSPDGTASVYFAGSSEGS